MDMWEHTGLRSGKADAAPWQGKSIDDTALEASSAILLKTAESEKNKPIAFPKDEQTNAKRKQESQTTSAPVEGDVGKQRGPRSSNNATTEDQYDGEKCMPDDEDAAPHGGLETGSKGKVAVIMLALALALFPAALDTTIVTTALPTISEHFHSAAGHTWIGSAYLLANSASIPSWGKVSDIFGRKPMLLFANLVFLAGSLIAALSKSIGMLIAGRAVQGIGAGGLYILINIVIADLFSLRVRGAFYGMMSCVWAIAASLGPIVGGAFTQKASWRYCFILNLPLNGLAFLVLFFFLQLKTPRTPILDGLKAIDWVGSITVTGGTIMFLLGLQSGGATHPWTSPLVICLIVFGAMTWALFVFWEWKFAIYPIMPMEIFSNLSNIAILGVVFVHRFVFIAGSYYLPLYFQAVRGATPLLSGVYVLPTAIALGSASVSAGVFMKKTGKYLPPIYFGFFMIILGYGLFIDLQARSSWAKLVIFQIIAGIGIGPVFQAPIIAMQAHVNPRDVGTATSTLGFIEELATGTGVIIGQVVFQNEMKQRAPMLIRALGVDLAQQLGGGNAGANIGIIDALPPDQKSVVRSAFANSLQPMWAMYTAFAAFGLVLALLITRKQLSAQHEETQTGLEAEKENAERRTAEREERHASRTLKRQIPASTAGGSTTAAV